MKRSINKSLVLAVLVLAFAIAFVSPSQAEKKIKPIVLEGTYGVIGEDICVAHWTTPPGGNAGDPSVYWTKTSTMQGTATFYTDGTGIAEVNQVTITHPIYTPIPIASSWGIPLPPTLIILGSITTSHVSTAFTYKIDPLTRSISRTITNGSGTFISGSGLDGMTYTFTGFDTLGYVSLDTQTIIGASPVYMPLGGLENPIMSVTIHNGDNIYGIQDEMCQRVRSSVLIK